MKFKKIKKDKLVKKIKMNGILIAIQRKKTIKKNKKKQGIDDY